MKKVFLTLAVLVMAICASAQKNQYFWYQGNLMLGNPIAQIDSVTFGEGEPTDTLHILLPRTTTQTIVVHDTVYITVKDTNNSADSGDKTYLGHEYVDLGLPSGLLWSTCNVGAESPEQVGEYYAWGELETKSSYTNATYQYQDWYGTGEYVYLGDEISNTQYDVAKYKFGGDWRMPTSNEAQEILDNCQLIKHDNGNEFVGPNGNSIFIPKSGYRQWETIMYSYAIILWTGTYYPNSDPNYPDANSWAFNGGGGEDQAGIGILCRRFGAPVRPVLNKDVVANSGSGIQPATIVHDTIYITIHDTVCPNDVPEGAINGIFSVSADKKVRFSKGNLQYKASTNTWRFAENQSDVIGYENNNISSTYSGWIDLFGWGTGNNPTNVYGNYSTFTDWGTNAIINGGVEDNLWRTLTKDEWVYLCYGRTNAANLFGLGNINGINGIFLLPDNWITPAGISFVASTTQGLIDQGDSYESERDSHYSDNTYNAEQWSLMESAGAIFLPAAGARFGTEVNDAVGSNGDYWSATPNNSYNAYYFTFCQNYLKPQHNWEREWGRSVRLVQDVK